MQKMWGGRFAQATDHSVETFTASITFDHALAKEDLLGSLAHITMLGHCKILPAAEVTQIKAGLLAIATKLASGTHAFSISDEDIHMNIERLLGEEIGIELAGKLHTARSRNDQVALDLHLYLRHHVVVLIHQLAQLQQALLSQAEQHLDTVMPGYTHLQRAQPILFSHHLLAYVAMLQRDIARLQDSWPRINQMPLGAGALAGTGFPIDRHYVAKLLDFDGVYGNSLDAVSDRDFAIEFSAHSALIMMHLSRLSEELILWSSQEFAFIELADGFCTGSSMMPQKKNPDVPELVRGKTGRVYGALTHLLTLLKGLPLAYNKDLQEDKEPIFDTVKTLEDTLAVYPAMLNTMKARKQNMLKATHAGFMQATDLADYLASKGVPFRQAHEIVGKLVGDCVERACDLTSLSLAELQKFSKHFSEDVLQRLDIHQVVNARHSYGGTAKVQVQQQCVAAKAALAETTAWANAHQQRLQRVEQQFLG